MQIFFVYFAVFACVLIFADFWIRRLRDFTERKTYVNYRISLIQKNPDRKVVYDRMLRERGLDYNAAKSLASRVKRMISQTGIRFEWFRSVSYIFASLLIGFVVFYLLGFGLIISFLFVLPLVFFLIVFLITRIRSLRIGKFVIQLPEALDVVVRSLAAGHPLATSIALVSRELPDPVGSEFGIMSDEMTYGVDIDTATRNMSTRVGAEELDLLAIALTVQRGAGGNLSEILANLSDMLRRRTMMKAKIKAISAEGRATSWVMLVFPFGLYGMIKLLAPEYFDPIWESGYALIFIMVGFSLMTVGMLVLRKIVNFDF